MFQKALDDGRLEICMVSVIFFGLDNSLTANAKHAVFHDPSDLTLTASHPVNHEIYFNVSGANKSPRRLQHDDYDRLILSFVSNRVDEIPEDKHNLEKHDNLQQSDHSNVVSDVTKPLSPQVTEPPQIISETEQLQSSLYQMTQNIVTDELDSGDEHTLSLNEATNFDYFIHHLGRYRNEGKVEFYHVFDLNSLHQMSEVFKIFIRNVSLCILVTESSQYFLPKEIDILRNNLSSSQKGLVLESCKQEANSRNESAKNSTLQQFSNFLVNEDANLFSMDCMRLEKSDQDVGNSILAHAVSLSSSTMFPFSWYLFGFRLVQIMNKKHTVSVSKDGMKIASELNMDRPTVEAALEHLMEHNIILYFRDILKDTIFLGVRLFSDIFSLIYEKSNRLVGTISQSDFENATSSITKHVSSSDFSTLFTKLMVMAPYNSDADGKDLIMPCLLTPLNEKAVKEICRDFDLHPVYFKCPSSGYEFITMLTAFLLNLPSGNWQILKDNAGYPVCLHKNCVQFKYGNNFVVNISFMMGQITVFARSEQSFGDISATVLQGLEKLKIILNSYHSFSFSMSFPCHCGKTDLAHSANYNSESGLLMCDDNKSISSDPTSAITRWINISG